MYKNKGTKKKQFWFCPNDVNGCMVTRSRWILHYPAIPNMWHVMVGTNLTQAEVEGLEAVGFKIDNRERLYKMQDRSLLRSESVP
jgi:hypothetical protein